MPSYLSLPRRAFPAVAHRGAFGSPARRRPTTRAPLPFACNASTPANMSAASDGSAAASPEMAASGLAGAVSSGVLAFRGLAMAVRRLLRSGAAASGPAGAGAPGASADASVPPGTSGAGFGAVDATGASGRRADRGG